MKKTIISVLLIIVLMSCVTAVYADLEDTSVISVSLVNQDPDPAIAGDVVEVRLGLQNMGGKDTENLMIEFVPEYPFTLVPGEDAVQAVPTLQGYQGYYDPENTKIMKYKLRVDKDATAGSYELNINYYEKGSTVIGQKTLSLDVKSRESAEVIHIDKTSLVPGKQSSLRFSINNVGNAPLRDMTFYWENEDGVLLPVGSDNTRYVRYLDIGESSEIEYQVIADTNAVAGLYKLNLYLSYYDPANLSTKTISTIAGVYIGGETDFDVAFADSSNSQTSFSIANIGSNPATSVSIMVPEQRGWTVSGSNTVIIGNLNKGDYTVASFNLQSSGGMVANMTARTRTATQDGFAQGPPQEMMNASRQMNVSSNKLLIRIAYTDTMGERRMIEKEVNIGSQSASSSDTMAAAFQARRGAQSQSTLSKYGWYLLFIVVVVVVFVLFKAYKRKKMQDPDFRIKSLFRRKKVTIASVKKKSKRGSIFLK
ncbi:MAG: COG1361 S-layer family protein [Nanoarchaeota archaeon]|nr:COG1361 S-layer family protein [Nanoarchaeota archaeon]